MAEFVKIEQPKKVTVTNKRVKLIIFYYLLNFCFIVVLLKLYDNFILSGMTFLLIMAFASHMISQKITLNGVMAWNFVYLIINIFYFGWGTKILYFNVLLVILNLLYFRNLIKKVNVTNDETKEN